MAFATLAVNCSSIIVPASTYWIFGWVFEVPPNTMWRWLPGETLAYLDIRTLLVFFIINSILSLFSVILYLLLYDSIPGCGVVKGAMFGLLLYPVGVIMPVFSLWFLTKISISALLFFSADGLLEFIVYGLIIALMTTPTNGGCYPDAELA